VHSRVHRITFPLLFQWFLCTVHAKRPCLGCIEFAPRTDRPDLGDQIGKGWPTVPREPEFCAALASIGAKRRKRNSTAVVFLRTYMRLNADESFVRPVQKGRGWMLPV